MIRFACPACEKILKAPEDGAGRHTSCPRCGQRLIVPQPVKSHGAPILGRLVPEAELDTQPATADPAPQLVASERRASTDQTTARAAPADQVNVRCPICKAAFLVPRRAIGFWTTCPKCGSGFAASTDEDETTELGRRRRWFRWPARSCLAGLVLLSVLAIGVYLLYSGRPSTVRSLFGAPSTCKELAERLQASGLDIHWRGRPAKYPSIYIAKRGSGAYDFLEMPILPLPLPEGGMAVITQFPSAQAAAEEAGSSQGAYAYGRFVIYGDPAFIEELKRHL